MTLRVEVRGARSVARLAERLSEIDGVTSQFTPGDREPHVPIEC